jgi:hypothetical protein
MSEESIMPGASWMGRGKPISERTTAELVGVFIVLPVLLGGLLVTVVVCNAVARAGSFTLGDWFWQVVWVGLLGLGLAVSLPAVAFQEFRRRRAQRSAGAEANTTADGRRDAG